MLRNGAAEIVVGSYGVDLKAVASGLAAEFAAARLRHIERVAVRTLAVDFHALVSELVRAFDDLFDSERISAIPDASIGDAVQADFHVGGGHRCASQVGRGKRTRCQRRGLDEPAPADRVLIVIHDGITSLASLNY